MFLSRTPLLPPRAGTTTRTRLPPSIDASGARLFDRPFELRQTLHHDDLTRVERVASKTDERAPARPCGVEVGGAVTDHHDLGRRESLASDDVAQVLRLGSRPPEHVTKIRAPSASLDDPAERDLRRRRVHVERVPGGQSREHAGGPFHLPTRGGELLADGVITVGALLDPTLGHLSSSSPARQSPDHLADYDISVTVPVVVHDLLHQRRRRPDRPQRLEVSLTLHGIRVDEDAVEIEYQAPDRARHRLLRSDSGPSGSRSSSDPRARAC